MLTVESRFKEDGREVSLDQFADELGVKFARALKEQISAGKNEDLSSAYDQESQGKRTLVAHGEGDRLRPKAVGINEAARLLGIRPPTLRVAVKDGRIRIVRIGRRVLVPMESIEKEVREGISGRG